MVKETEEDIRSLQKKEIVHDKLYRSNPDFSYQPVSFSVAGEKTLSLEEDALEKEKELFRQRKNKAAQIKAEVDKLMNNVPARIQRIIKYKFFERLSWKSVALRKGRTVTADRVRMELEKFFHK